MCNLIVSTTHNNQAMNEAVRAVARQREVLITGGLGGMGRAARDPLTRDLYLARLADVSHLDKVTLSTEADAVTEQGRRRAPGGPPERSSDEPMPEFEGTAAESEPAPLPPPEGDKPVWKGRKNSKYGGGPEWKTTNIPPRPRRDEPIERSLVRAMLADRGIAERVAERGHLEVRVVCEFERDLARTDAHDTNGAAHHR